MRVPASKRVALLLIVPVVLIAGAVFATAQVERHAALVGSRRAAVSGQLLTSILNQETGARGFFETLDPVFLGPWERGTKSFASSLSALRLLVAGDTTMTQMVDDQARRANAWHAATAVAIAGLRRGGRPETVAAALAGKNLMDAFRTVHSAFDVQLVRRSRESLTAASEVAAAVAAVLAIALAWLGLSLTRRSGRLAATRQRGQSELRELLQASDSERESRALLIRHIEKMLPGARAAVLNRNNSDDRLEVTSTESGYVTPDDSPLSPANVEKLRPRSCMAVRLSRSFAHGPGDSPLVPCDICSGRGGTSACEPLLVGGQVIGSVLVISERPIDEERRVRLRESVAQATPILANQRNLMLAETRAASDALTGLPNRRAATETLNRMAAHAGRTVSPLAAILLDLDHFKTINDRYGHESGDKALALVGRIITATIRGSDFAARFGGEEFLVLLPDSDREGAMIVAEKLRTEIEHAAVAGIGAISASLGVAELPADAADADELLRKADRALYTAKESGRNRVHAYTTPPAPRTDHQRVTPRPEPRPEVQGAAVARRARSDGPAVAGPTL